MQARILVIYSAGVLVDENCITQLSVLGHKAAALITSPNDVVFITYVGAFLPIIIFSYNET